MLWERERRNRGLKDPKAKEEVSRTLETAREGAIGEESAHVGLHAL